MFLLHFYTSMNSKERISAKAISCEEETSPFLVFGIWKVLPPSYLDENYAVT
jgi:hypothetical protein